MGHDLVRSAVKLARDEKRQVEAGLGKKFRFVVALLFKMR
jgi:hypothetical protein